LTMKEHKGVPGGVVCGTPGVWPAHRRTSWFDVTCKRCLKHWMGGLYELS